MSSKASVGPFALLAIGAVVAACAGGPYSAAASRTDELFSHIQTGMTQDEVTRVAGRPDGTMPFPISHRVAWDYMYTDTWGYLAEYSVTFDEQGRVVSTLSRRINVGGDHGSSK